MSKFTDILRYTLSNDKERKELLNNVSFKQSLGKEKHLLISEATDYSDLLLSEITKVIQDGAKERQCMRNVLPIVSVPEGYSSKITYGSTPTNYAGYVAEGAEIPIEVDTYDTTTITINKAATRPVITREMLEDSKLGVIELELKKAGARLENKLNQEAIGVLLDGANGTTPADVDPDGTHISLDDVASAYGSLSDIGWQPSNLVLHPLSTGYIQSDTGHEIKYKDGTLWNLKTHILDATVDGDKTNHWLSVDAATNYTGLLLDSTNYAMIAMKHDMRVEKFDDPINDLVGLTLTTRFGVGIMNDDACVRILAK